MGRTIEQLEQVINSIGYEELAHHYKTLNSLELDQLQALLAYEFSNDGMEWEDVLDVWEGKNPLYNTRESIITDLVDLFNYKP